MESPVVDDDICILKHETAYGPPESPVSVCAGDESVASHFALVTAYEDIKKRLRDTEKENGLLRRRVKQLEDKHFRPEAPPSEGPQYMNKAFSAYRGIYIEKEDLQMELNKLKKEKLDVERILTEQLQAKELELLQLRSEMETSQVMKSLTDTADYWQVDRCGSDMKIHSLQEQLERLQIENDALHKLCRAGQVRLNFYDTPVLHLADLGPMKLVLVVSVRLQPALSSVYHACEHNTLTHVPAALRHRGVKAFSKHQEGVSTHT
ncbi:5-azacytidine-induced protein 2 [Garra rufa]|uniref:5-azacytidine-induced protein 2 n=1 Tax=Garra rufa TaxID=137080 RepID=UPI003CCEA278